MHTFMKRFFLLFLIAVVFVGCKTKKTKLADDDTVAIVDFVDFFPDIKLPFKLDDSTLLVKETDSATIGYKIFTQFIPDTVITKQFGRGVVPKIYPLGKVAIKKYETYLFLKAVTANKKVGYIVALDRDNTFITAIPLVNTDKDPSTFQTGIMDSKYTVTELVQKKMEDGQYNEAKNVYILNSDARTFSLIMQDQVLADKQQDIINPIDTFQRRSKYAGDYVKDKRNYISIRDGKSLSNLLFFIHFEKNDGECTGELKGEATLHGAKTATYQANGNPCVLEFTFSGTQLSIKEQAACGSYRDIKCFFEGSFPKKKEQKAKVSSKKKK